MEISQKFSTRWTQHVAAQYMQHVYISFMIDTSVSDVTRCPPTKTFNDLLRYYITSQKVYAKGIRQMKINAVL